MSVTPFNFRPNLIPNWGITRQPRLTVRWNIGFLEKPTLLIYSFATYVSRSTRSSVTLGQCHSQQWSSHPFLKFDLSTATISAFYTTRLSVQDCVGPEYTDVPSFRLTVAVISITQGEHCAEQPLFHIGVVVSAFPDSKQNYGGKSSTVNASSNIKLSTTVSRNNPTKVDKLIDAFDVLSVNTVSKTAMLR